jgi:hypothetical protein
MSRRSTRAFLLALWLAPAPALADPVPLSALPEKPARYAQAEGPLHATVAPSGSEYQIHTTGSACLAYDMPAYWIDGDASLEGRYPDLQLGDPTPFGIERFVTRGDDAELERVTVSLLYGELVPSARSRISLHAVAKLDGLVVYAYRWNAKVFLLARSTGIALRRRDGGLGLEEAPGCGIALTMLRVRNGASQPVQIQGTVPGTGKRYLVDASVAQTGRDPEPLLSVRARLLDP